MAMHVTIVHIHLKPEHVADFVAETRLNHWGAIREPGCLRFDVLQSADDPTRFVLYEAYRDAADAVAHKQTNHYLAWRDAVASWMVEPRAGFAYVGLLPDDV